MLDSLPKSKWEGKTYMKQEYLIAMSHGIYYKFFRVESEQSHLTGISRGQRRWGY